MTAIEQIRAELDAAKESDPYLWRESPVDSKVVFALLDVAEAAQRMIDACLTDPNGDHVPGPEFPGFNDLADAIDHLLPQGEPE